VISPYPTRATAVAATYLRINHYELRIAFYGGSIHSVEVHISEAIFYY
jgi:hypothetical protein